MPWRPHGRAEVDPRQPEAFGVCDRCGCLYNLDRLHWQYQFAGVGLVNLNLLVCRPCLDVPQPQLTATILPPDPDPIFNARPEYYALDETGPVQNLSAEILYSGSSIPADFYLDLYLGDPSTTGVSVLSGITGSSVRPNAGGSFGMPVENIAANTSEVGFTDSAIASVNVDYVAVFDAETEGNLIASAPLFNPLTVVLYNGAAFEIGSLQVVVS
ncbi:MAG TPA: hypothetical protein VHE81_06560 [Lacipirellulaceae bacterium]|jgi:hypothetical protein|nr:hypothetical protein [Lacipirellulaceae bacterium]